jgi:hypothetical protein
VSSDSTMPLEILLPAGPAYHPEPRPLKAGSLRQVEGRAGAYSYRDVPSLMGGQRVPFVSSLTIIGGAADNE